MQTIQFIGITPEKVLDAFDKLVESRLQNLKRHFEPKNPTEFLTRKEVAEMLKIDLSTVHNWTKSKKLKAYSIGNRVYFKRVEVEESIIHINE